MNLAIKYWIRDVLKRYAKYRLGAYYLPKKDTYVIHLQGRAVMNFSGNNFYDISPTYRKKMLDPLIRVGLTHNLGESNPDQLWTRYKHGFKIV